MITDYERVKKAIEFVSRDFQRQPALEEVAKAVHLSPYHFQRLFKRWAGISPKRFLQFLTIEHAKELLAESRSLLDVALESGLSGPGRLHDLFVALEAVTPGEFKTRGRGVQISYAFCPSPFGTCLLAATDRGICHLSFVKGQNRQQRLEKLQRNWPRALLVENKELVKPIGRRIFEKDPFEPREPFKLFVRGTNFQIKVWTALLEISPGTLWAYGDLAGKIGSPEAVRAVAGAVGANPVSYLIPCHRVVRKFGGLGGYDGGLLRKRALIAWEASRRESAGQHRIDLE